MKKYVVMQKKLFDTITKTPIVFEHEELKISISMGIVSNKQCTIRQFTQLFELADKALYKAKKAGKCQIVSL